MANSGTYNFSPPLGQMALLAFARCGVRRTAILAEHMENAWLEMNALQSDWSTDSVTWWSVELIQQPLTVGQATYSVPANVVSILDVYISNGSSNRLIFPFSRTDYASLAEPTEQGFPTVFWFERNLSQSITLWPTPDGNATYTMGYYAYTQMQDATVRQGGSAAIPYWWINAYIADLAHRLSRIYAPTLEAVRKVDKDEAYARADRQVEPSAIYISPGLSGYFRS